MAFIAIAMVGTYLSFSTNDLRMTRTVIDHERAMMVAEAGLDHGVMRLREVITDYQLSPSWSLQQLSNEIGDIEPPPGMNEYQYLTPQGEKAFKIDVTSDRIDGTIPEGIFSGYDGAYQTFRITCGVINTNSGRGVVLQQRVQVVSLPLIRFGVFYDEDLEILPGANMIFDGPVHSNNNLFLGGQIRFNQRLTAAGRVYHRRKNDGSRFGHVDIERPNGQVARMRDGDAYIDSDHPSWTTLALNRWEGRIQSQEHGVSHLAPPINPMHNPQDLIRNPIEDIDDPGYSQNTEDEKFANKADLRIIFNDDDEIVVLDAHGDEVTTSFQEQPNLVLDEDGWHVKDSDSGHYELDGDGIFTTNATFFDQREQREVKVIDLYLDRLQNEFSGLTDLIVHVTAPHESDRVVRLRNGSEIVLQHGISVASDLPVYIEGDFNSQNPKPSLVAGDAVTILSRNWQDGRSTQHLDSRPAESTEVRAVVITGNTETTPGNYNGGLENVLRFLEGWSGHTLTYRGSIIVLWQSEIATGPWSFGHPIYNAPTRNWGYDSVFLYQAPPGMTRVFGMEELVWSRVGWDDQTW